MQAESFITINDKIISWSMTEWDGPWWWTKKKHFFFRMFIVKNILPQNWVEERGKKTLNEPQMIPMPSAELIIVFVRSHFDVKTRPNEKKSNRRHSSVCMHEGNKCEILFILRLHNKDANAFLNQWCEWCALSVPFYYYFPLNFFFVLFFGCGKRNSTRINRIIRASPSNNDGARNCWFNHLQNLWHDHSSSYFISTLLPSSSREKKKKYKNFIQFFERHWIPIKIDAFHCFVLKMKRRIYTKKNYL